VVVDTPPLAVTTEALEFVPAAKVVVLVGRIGRTATAAAQRAGELARFGGAEQIAVAITDTGRSHLRRSHYYDYYGELGGRRRGRKGWRSKTAAATPPAEQEPASTNGEGADAVPDEWQEIDELVQSTPRSRFGRRGSSEGTSAESAEER
jgi:hypothetical protein